MKIYIILGHTGYAHSNEVRFVALDYHKIVMYVRKHSLSENKIVSKENANWYDAEEIISKSVYKHAYNGFSHYTDKNYD